MALRVPEQQIVHIKKFLELPDDKVDAFLDSLAEAGPQFNVYDLADQISGPLELPQYLTLGIVEVLASLYVTRDLRQPIEEFVDKEVFVALRRAQAFSAEHIELQWGKLRKFLVTALSLERSVGTAAKAGRVHTHHERIFDGARIMTDLRPIFHLNVSDKPDAAVIVHMLKIIQRDTLGHKAEQFIALDSNDLVSMKEIIDRAMNKEKTIRRIMKDSGVTVLDPKLVF